MSALMLIRLIRHTRHSMSALMLTRLIRHTQHS